MARTILIGVAAFISTALILAGESAAFGINPFG